MYEPQFWIDRELYPYLVRWALSMGYQVKTNERHNLLYDLSCIDPIRIRELRGNDAAGSLNREEAVDLVEALEDIRTSFPMGKDAEMSGEGVTAYDPPYHPPIRLDEDMYQKHFLPDMKEAGYEVEAVHKGIFWQVTRVARSDYDAAKWETEEGVLCRSEVTGMVRDLEFERRISPYIVACDLRTAGGAITKSWLNGLDSLDKAVEVLEREKPRSFPAADWRIYAEVTAIARTLNGEFSGDVVKPEGWLWLRIWHPGTDGGDWWYEARFDNLSDVRVAIVEEEALEMYCVTAVYACIRQDRVAEEEQAKLKRPPFVSYKVIYWSSRKKQDISEAYGEVIFDDRRQVSRACSRLKGSKDIYKIESWKRIGLTERDILVEEYHGNPAHLKRKNATMEGED